MEMGGLAPPSRGVREAVAAAALPYVLTLSILPVRAVVTLAVPLGFYPGWWF